MRTRLHSMATGRDIASLIVRDVLAQNEKSLSHRVLQLLDNDQIKAKELIMSRVITEGVEPERYAPQAPPLPPKDPNLARKMRYSNDNAFVKFGRGTTRNEASLFHQSGQGSMTFLSGHVSPDIDDKWKETIA